MLNQIKKHFTLFDRIVLLLFLVTISMVVSISNNYSFVEVHYTQKIYPFIASFLSNISNLIFVSLWDLFWIIFVVFVIFNLLYLIFVRGKRLQALKRIVLFILGGITWFYWSWGFNYFREPIELRYSLPIVSNDSTLLLRSLDTIIVNVNRNYIAVDSIDKFEIDLILEESFKEKQNDLHISYPMGKRKPKDMIFSTFYAKTGILGYYGPFFNEVHVNNYLLPFQYPYTLAHEKSHQLGITSEAECNFWAYIITKDSQSKLVRYSGYLSVLDVFLYEAAVITDIKPIIAKIDKRVIADMKMERAHWLRLRNEKMDKIQNQVNDAYLKTNKVRAGIKDYNRVVALILGWNKLTSYSQ